MAPKRQSLDNGTAFDITCEQLGRALKKTGSIRLLDTTTAKLKIALTAVRTSRTAVPDAYLARLVSILDSQRDACRRLEPKTYVAILESVLCAGYSRTKERGVYLLAASISCDTHTSPASSLKTMRRRKAAIGKGCLWAILDCFTNPTEDARIRRWVGVLISSLLERCEENAMTFKAGPEAERRKLGTMVMDEGNEIIRTSCGHILKTLIAQDVPSEWLWPVNARANVYAEFPASCQNERSWHQAFQTYIDRLWADSSTPPSIGNLYFPLAVTTEGCQFNAAGCHIYLLIDNELSVYATSDGGGFDQSLDIPVHLVSDVVISETLLDDGSRAPDQPLVVIVTLSSREGASCYLNALPVTLNEVHISVHDDKTAEVMGLEIHNASKRPKISQTTDTISVGLGINEWPLMESEPSSGGSLVISGMEKIKSQINLVNSHSPGSRYSYHPAMSSESCPKPPRDVSCQSFIQQISSLDSKKQGESKHDRANLMNASLDERGSSKSHKNQLTAKTRPGQSRESRVRSTSLDLDESVFAGDYSEIAEPRLRRSMKGISDGQGALLQPFPGDKTKSLLTNAFPPRQQFSEETCSQLREEAIRFELPKMALQQERLMSIDPQACLETMERDISAKPLFPREGKGRTNKYTVKPKRQLGLAASVGIQKSSLTAKIKTKALGVPLVTGAISEFRNSTAPHGLARPVSDQNGQASQNTFVTRGEAVRVTPAIGLEDDWPDDFAGNNNCGTAYSAKLSEMLEGIEDFQLHAESSVISRDEPETQSWTEEPQLITPAKYLRKSPFPPPNSSGVIQKEVDPFCQDRFQEKEVEGPEESIRKVLFRPKEAAAVLNNVLSRIVDLDDRLIRKTPLVGFNSKGPRNQGSSKAKLLPRPRLNTASQAPGRFPEQEKYTTKRELKRKRGVEAITERDSVKRYQTRSFDDPIIAVTSRQGEYARQEQQNEQDDQVDLLNHVEQADPDALPVVYFDQPHRIPGKGTPVTAQKRGVGSHISHVDENGSPHASSTTYQQREHYRAVTSKVLRNEKGIGKTTSTHTWRRHQSPTNKGLRLPPQTDLTLSPCTACEVPKRWPSPECSDEPRRLYLSPQQNPMRECAQISHVEDGMVGRPEIRERGNMQTIVSSSHTENQSIHGGRGSYIVGSPGMEDTVGRGLASPLAIPRRDVVTRKSATGYQYDFSRRKEYSPYPHSKKKAPMREVLEEILVTAPDDIQTEEANLSSDEEAAADEYERQTKDEHLQECDENAEKVPLNVWREALKPHQRDMLDALCLISSDLVMYLINDEEAIADVLKEYIKYGNRLVEDYQQKQEADCQGLQKRFRRMRKVAEAEYQESRLEILQNAKDIRTRPVAAIQEEWRHQQEVLYKLIAEGKGKVDCQTEQSR